MIEALLVVLSNPVPGRDDDFNDWYTNIHVRDAMRFRGSIATQRFRLADRQGPGFPENYFARYLALYEVYDAQRFVQEHFDASQTPRMVVGDSFDRSRIDDYHYYTLAFRDKAPRTMSLGSVIMEQIDVPEDRSQAFEAWYAEHHMTDALTRPGVSAAAFLRYEPHGQLLQSRPQYSHVAIYRLADDSARSSWQSPSGADSAFGDRIVVATTYWDVLTPRLTADEVCHPRAAALAAEEAARASVGNRVHKGTTMKAV